MKINATFICLMMLVGLFICIPVWAQEKAPDAKETEAPKLTAEQMADFSREVAMMNHMVSFAEANKDSLVMIGAVRILDSLPFQGVAKPGSDEKKATPYDRTEMLKQAKEYASGDKEVLALITKIEEVPETTAVRAPGRFHHGGFHGVYHGGFHGGYHGPGYWHPRRERCMWFERCGRWGCEWICR